MDGHEPIEALHRTPRPVRIVVGKRRPQLVGSQHQPRAASGLGPRQSKRVAGEQDRSSQEREPPPAVVGHPGIALQASDAARVERAMRLDHAGVADFRRDGQPHRRNLSSRLPPVGSRSMTRSAVVGAGAETLVGTLTAAGVRDERVIEAFRLIPRHEFVPPEQRHRAYDDVPLPIPRDQVTTQPSLMARMVEGMALDGNERVLEIGTGYGFQTAILATLARVVWSIERWPELMESARSSLKRRQIVKAHFVRLVGEHGFPTD